MLSAEVVNVRRYTYWYKGKGIGCFPVFVFTMFSSLYLTFEFSYALVLKFGTLPLSCLFSKTLLVIVDTFFVEELFTVLYRKMV